MTARRLVTTTARTVAERGALLLAILAFLPLTITLWQGQLAIPIWLALTGAVLALRAGQERRAGAWLILGLLKPQLIALPLLALLVGRRWRALGVVAAGTAGVLGVSLLAFGNWSCRLPGLPEHVHPRRMQRWATTRCCCKTGAGWSTTCWAPPAARWPTAWFGRSTRSASA